MGKITLTNYLNRMEAKYIQAREDWEKLQKKLFAEETRFANVKWSNLSSEGIREEHERHRTEREKVLKELETLRQNFSESVDKIKSDSDKLFDRNYKYTPSDIDSNGVFILQNGDLSDKELMDLAERYRKEGNYTMYYMAADKMKIKDVPLERQGKKDEEVMSYYRKARDRREEREDHVILDSFKEVCLKALRDEDYLSNGIDNEHMTFYQNWSKRADEIICEAPSPWD